MGSRFHVIYKLMKYYLIAGEASGDLYGSQLIREIKKFRSGCTVQVLGRRFNERGGG